MNQETKICVNCQKEFIVEPQDFAFYEKMGVPAPTFCPECRFQRRLIFLNFVNLYKRKCDLCGKETISTYTPESPYKVYCPACWWSDDWDPTDYGRNYDFSRPFFEQFNELWHEVPIIGLSIDIPTFKSSPFTHQAGHLKNCYLLFHSDFVEDSACGMNHVQNKSVFNCFSVILSELCHDSIHIFKVNRGIGLDNVNESLDCAFLRNCVNCQNCFASANLRNKSYFIFNKPYAKEDYFREIKKWDLGSYKIYQEIKKTAVDHWKKYPPQPRRETFSKNISGNYVFESKNCHNYLDVTGCQDCKHLFLIYQQPTKDCYDISSWGNNLSLSYECSNVGENVSSIKFCQESGINLYNADYCKLSTGGSFHFGCVSIKKGNYIIFNKPYAKDEYFALRKKIIKQMNEMPFIDKKSKKTYKYGEFFPPELSPFAYNETVAHKFFPLAKEQAINQGYKWRDAEEKEYQTTISWQNLPDHIKDAPDSIINEIIKCQNCARGYKIIPMELNFLRERNLPLPRQCPFCRIDEKFNQWVKNLRLFKRTCSQCGAEFETPYPKNEVEYILCNKCWLKEVI